MKKSYILVPLLVGILMISAVHVPAAKAMNIADILVQIQQLQKVVAQLQQQLLSILAPGRNISSPVNVKPAKLCLSSDLYYGITGNQVRILQEGLKRDPSVFPPYPGEPAVSTGHFGPKTRAAVINFQIKYHLPVTGKVDYSARAKFNELYCYNTTSTTNYPSTSSNYCSTLNGKYSMPLTEAKYLFKNSECKSLGNPDVLPVKCLQCNPETIHSRLYNAIYGEDTALSDKAAYEIGQCIINVKTKQAYINKGPGFCAGATDVGGVYTIVCAEQGTPKEGWYEVRGYDDVMNPNLRIKLLKLTHCSNCQLKCTPSGFVDTCDNSLLKTLKEAFGPEVDSCYKSGVPPVDPSYIRNLIKTKLSNT